MPCATTVGTGNTQPRVASHEDLQHNEGERVVIFDRIEWDDANLDHATVRATAAEIEQAILNARRAIPSRFHEDRVLFRSVTDGGRRLTVVVQIVRDGVRPIAAWDE